MHATLVVLIDREREEQKNSSDVPSGRDVNTGNFHPALNSESNTFMKAYQVGNVSSPDGCTNASF